MALNARAAWSSSRIWLRGSGAHASSSSVWMCRAASASLLHRARHAPAEPEGGGHGQDQAGDAEQQRPPQPLDLHAGDAGRQVGADDPGLVAEARDLAVEHHPVLARRRHPAHLAAQPVAQAVQRTLAARPHRRQHRIAGLGQQRQRMARARHAGVQPGCAPRRRSRPCSTNTGWPTAAETSSTCWTMVSSVTAANTTPSSLPSRLDRQVGIDHRLPQLVAPGRRAPDDAGAAGLRRPRSRMLCELRPVLHRLRALVAQDSGRPAAPA